LRKCGRGGLDLLYRELGGRVEAWSGEERWVERRWVRSNNTVVCNNEASILEMADFWRVADFV
jgi:hypothetical protein